MRKDNTIKAFFALAQGGLWERDVFLQQYGSIDYDDVMLLAEEQSMVGLVTAGLEHVKDVKVPQDILLQFIGETLQIEQANIEMNAFISALVEKMRKADIYSLLLKGQGVAQCYERPLWRACGDVDLLVGNKYEESKTFLSLIASSAEVESLRTKHIGYTIDSWTVELHGTIHCALSKKMDNAIDEFQKEVFEGNRFRVWNNDGTNVLLPDANYDTEVSHPLRWC